MEKKSKKRISVSDTSVPLCVDLDGTLIQTDLLYESLLCLLIQRPWSVFALPFWMLKGKAHAKAQVAQRVVMSVANLPYRRDLLDFLKTESEKGRRLVLATGSDERLAQQVAGYLGLFHTVIASDGRINVSASQKRLMLVDRFGSKQFDYVGNHRTDLVVWDQARQALAVSSPERWFKRRRTQEAFSHVFKSSPSRWSDILEEIRLHQWSKNLLVFVPLVTSHELLNPTVVAHAAVAFIAFSLGSSAIYLINDLLDLGLDRQHPVKKQRPLAAGRLSIPVAGVLIAACVVGSVATAMVLPPAFSVTLAVYGVVALAYSLGIKRVMFLDTVILACLYVIRVIGGLAATDIAFSPWLLGFCLFLFLSLATLKRYTELIYLQRDGKSAAKGRDYLTSDLPILGNLGASSGYLAVLVFALYIDNQRALLLYRHPLVLWGLCPILIYWLSRLWLLAQRGLIDEDAIRFSLKDRTSYAVLLMSVVVLLLAR